MRTMEMSDVEQVARQATEAAVAPHFLERLAERIGGQASVRAVFGDPIERGDLTIVPVARVRWGFGGGAGNAIPANDAAGSGSGSGGGGGAGAEPVGFLEIGPDGATFQPIAQPSQVGPPFVLAAGIAAAVVLRALSRLRRG